MARKKKIKTPEEVAFEKNVKEFQVFEKPSGESNRFIRKFHYMLMNKNYIMLTPNAARALEYMKDWAFNPECKDFIKNHTFEYSITMLENLGVMTAKTANNAFDELEYYGFIKKENNACKSSGVRQIWSFSDEWYREIKPKYKRNKKT